MAPNRRPPGKRRRAIRYAISDDTAAISASSMSELPDAGAGTTITPAAAKPNSASPLGNPIVTTRTRMVCTMATPRMSAPNSAASATTWAIAPGLAPSSAESGSQPWASRK